MTRSRITVSLLLSLIVAGCAHTEVQPPAKPASERITLDLDMTEVHVVLAEIARQSGISLVYRGSWERLVSVSLHDAPWRDAVQAVAQACDLDVAGEASGIVRVTER